MSNIFEFQRFAKKKNVVPTRVKEVWCYTRVSSKEQESNYSLQTQKISAEKFAQEKGFVLVKTFGGTQFKKNQFII